MKINKQKVCRIIALLMVVLQVLIMSPMEVFAKNSKRKESNGNVVNDIIEITPNKNNQNSSNKGKTKRQLKADIKNNKKSKNEKIRIEYDKSDIKKYRYETEGIEVENISDMKFDIVAKDQFGSLDIYADYGENEEIKSSIYTYVDDDGTVYVSEISKDFAWYDCMKEKYEQGLLSVEEIEDKYSKISRMYVTGENYRMDAEPNTLITYSAKSTGTSSNVVKAVCKLSWETQTGTTLPLKNTFVELHIKKDIGSVLLTSGMTGDNGEIIFTVDSTKLDNNKHNLFIRYYTKSDTFEVGQRWFSSSAYYIDSEIIKNVILGEEIVFDDIVEYNETVNMNKAFYVQQGLIVAQNFAYKMGMRTD
ncbi:MAG: hypothetical protein IJ272_02820, partial [Clostridia bacterium]|nr:hypothetical protein [Clostridia bacterium]